MSVNSLEDQNINSDSQNDKNQSNMTAEKAMELAEKFDKEIVAMGGSHDKNNFYFDAYMKGTMDENLVRESVRMQLENERGIQALASQNRGKVITPSLIYRENVKLFNNLLYGFVAGGNADAVDTTSSKQILENLFQKLGISFQWEDIDIRQFELDRQKHVDFIQCAESLRNSLKTVAKHKISVIDLWRTDKKSFMKILSYLKDDKTGWTAFMEEYMPEYVGKIDFNNFKFDAKNVEIKSMLGNKLRVKARNYSKVTPFGIFRADKTLYKNLYHILGNNKSEWIKFLKEYVNEDIVKKFDFSPVDIRAVEKRDAEDKILKSIGNRLQSLIKLVESKEGSGGIITPESIYKYGKKYNINIYPAIVNIIGHDKTKWKRFFRKFLPNYKNRFSFSSVNKGKVDKELNHIEQMRKLGYSLRELIDSKGAGEVTTKSIFKYAPGLFQKLENKLGRNSSNWKNFIKKYVGPNYANRFFYISFSKNEVYTEKKISTLNNILGGKLEELCNILKKTPIELEDIKYNNPILYFQLLSTLGDNESNWERYIQKSLPPHLWDRFNIKFLNNPPEKQQNPYYFMIKDIRKMQIDMSKMRIPIVLMPQFFMDNFPREFEILNREIKGQKDKWDLFIQTYFPKLKNRFLWKPITVEEEKKTPEDSSIQEEIDDENNLSDGEKLVLDAYNSVIGDLLKKQFQKDREKFSIHSFIKENNVLIKNIQEIIGNDNKTLQKYIIDICHKENISNNNIDKINFNESINIQDEIHEKISEIFIFRLEKLIFDLTQYREQITLQDIYDYDPKLISELQNFLDERHISIENYIIDKLSIMYKSKILFGEIKKDLELDEQDIDIYNDIFDENTQEDYKEEKTKTIQAVKNLLKEENDGDQQKQRYKDKNKDLYMPATNLDKYNEDNFDGIEHGDDLEEVTTETSDEQNVFKENTSIDYKNPKEYIEIKEDSENNDSELEITDDMQKDNDISQPKNIIDENNSTNSNTENNIENIQEETDVTESGNDIQNFSDYEDIQEDIAEIDDKLGYNISEINIPTEIIKEHKEQEDLYTEIPEETFEDNQDQDEISEENNQEEDNQNIDEITYEDIPLQETIDEPTVEDITEDNNDYNIDKCQDITSENEEITSQDDTEMPYERKNIFDENISDVKQNKSVSEKIAEKSSQGQPIVELEDIKNDNKEKKESILDQSIEAGIMAGAIGIEFHKEKKEDEQTLNNELDNIKHQEPEDLNDEKKDNTSQVENNNDALLDNDLMKSSTEILISKLEELIEKNIQNFEIISLNWLLNTDRDLYYALKYKLSNSEFELKKLINQQLDEFKSNYLRRSKKEKIVSKKNDIKLTQEEIIRNIDTKMENEEDENSQIQKKNLKNLIIHCIENYKESNNAKNIQLNFQFPISVTTKQARNPDTIISIINQNFRNIFHIEGFIKAINIKLLNYSEYLSTASCDLIFEVFYVLAGLENEKNMWKFEIKKVNLEEIQ